MRILPLIYVVDTTLYGHFYGTKTKLHKTAPGKPPGKRTISGI